MDNLNDLVDNIYLINMKKDFDRLEQFKSYFKSDMKFQIIDGVDINNKKINTIYLNWKKKIMPFTKKNFDWKYYINKYQDLQKAGIKTQKSAWSHYKKFGKNEMRKCNPINQIRSIAELGCLLSHINVIKDAIKNKYENILILEDDVIPTKHYKKKILKNLNEYMQKKPWKIIYLSASQNNWDNVKCKNGYYIATKNTKGSHSYVVKKSSYKIILKEFEKLQNASDVCLVNLQNKYQNQIVVKYPNIFMQDLSFQSNIWKDHNTKKSILYRKFKWI
jgi:GR25 family glycosyltransferase involved in LPS biosynthesis